MEGMEMDIFRMAELGISSAVGNHILTQLGSTTPFRFIFKPWYRIKPDAASSFGSGANPLAPIGYAGFHQPLAWFRCDF
jgi:hypothetical protein